MKKRQVLGALVAGLLLILGFQNCAKNGIQVEDLLINQQSSEQNIPTDTPNKSFQIQPASDYICSPFGGDSGASAKSGLKGELRYLAPGSSVTGLKAVEYFDNRGDVIPVSSPIYLSDLNVPTRKFDTGFASSTNNVIKDNNGNVLIEYFALRMESVLKLGPNDPEGVYDLATISDDGTVVQLQDAQGHWVDVIQNDDQHSPRMMCGSTQISSGVQPTARLLMTKASRVPVRIYYNQGPRILIAAVLMWNYRGTDGLTPVNSDAAIRAHCGTYSDFYDPNTQGLGLVGMELYGKLKWAPLTADNFQLPKNETNPCAFANLDIIKSMTYADADGSMIVNFALTDPSAGQVKLFSVGEDGARQLFTTLTFSSAQLNHRVVLPALDPQLKYKLEVTFSVPSKSVSVIKEYDVLALP